jgi:hypothetical protein
VVVCRDQRGGPLFLDEGPEGVENELAGCGIEVARRLVGENDAGAVGRGAGDGDTLLLAA